MARANFTKSTIEILAKRVAFKCSNPSCTRDTTGPNKNHSKATNIGVAAHIYAASKGGPRFNDSMNHSDRKSINNGIWLCANCSILIDRDYLKYTAELLYKWKYHAEKVAALNLENRVGQDLQSQDSELIFTHNTALKNTKDLGLILSINHSEFNEEIILHYYPNSKEWDHVNERLVWNSPYEFAISDISNDIDRLLNAKLFKSCRQLINDLKAVASLNGMYGISEYKFNRYNRYLDLAPFEDYVSAFKKFLPDEHQDYVAIPLGHSVHMKNDSTEYIIETWNGKMALLKYYIENNRLDEILVMTHYPSWEEVFMDPGILKEELIPILLSKWEEYWSGQSERGEDALSEILEHKAKSWRKFQLFASDYHHINRVLGYAYSLEPEVLYPLAVISMVEFYDDEVCYSEYCEFFFSNGWTDITLTNTEVDNDFFYIKQNNDYPL